MIMISLNTEPYNSFLLKLYPQLLFFYCIRHLLQT